MNKQTAVLLHYLHGNYKLVIIFEAFLQNSVQLFLELEQFLHHGLVLLRVNHNHLSSLLDVLGYLATQFVLSAFNPEKVSNEPKFLLTIVPVQPTCRAG